MKLTALQQGTTRITESIAFPGGEKAKGSCIIDLGSTVLCGDECYIRENLLGGHSHGQQPLH